VERTAELYSQGSMDSRTFAFGGGRHGFAGLRLAILTLACLGPAAAGAQTADNLLLVINNASPASVQIGEYYARRRAVPPDRIVHLTINTTAPAIETISRVDYMRTIEAPIAVALTKSNLQDKVLYLVLTKGVPLRVLGTGGLQGTTASVDSELTLLYRKMLGVDIPVGGRIPNPYFLDDKPIADARPFTRTLSDLYLVTRLDGFTVDDVLKLIDRGAAPTTTGSIVLDKKATLIDRGGDLWLEETADRLRKAGAGDRVVLEGTRALASAPGPVLGYYSWGSNDPANQLRRFHLAFAPGAIGGMFVSTDGRTFQEPPATWTPSPPTGGPQWMGSSQSLAGDLIRDGITGVSAHVSEPFLDGTIRPQILFPAYLAGFNLAESFYLAMPFLSWQTVVVGDPLCAPFSSGELASADTTTSVDPDTGFPPVFSAREIALASKGGLNVDGIRAGFKGNVAAAAGHSAEAEALWVRATELEPRLVSLQARLATIYDARGDYDKAIDRYRRILANTAQQTRMTSGTPFGMAPSPFDDAYSSVGNPLALNNLAYDLAVHANNPKDALIFAKRAYSVDASPGVADTLGWVEHLLGDDAAARPLLEGASAGAPKDAEILFHVAVVHAALGDKAIAKQELDAAEKLDPKLTARDDVKALRALIRSSLTPA
jgi:uncharacterized protein (TIGR03790 family)